LYSPTIKNANDMKTNLPFMKKISNSLAVGCLSAVLFSCGSYQNTSYYDNDGVYSDTAKKTNNVNPDNTNSDKYKEYFSSLNQDSNEIFTDIENYSSVSSAEPVNNTEEYNDSYSSWGNNPQTVTVNIYDNSWGSGYWNNYWYGNYWGYNNWAWNSWYGPSWGWNAGWGWNNWYGGWNSPYWGNYWYGNNWYGNGWNNGWNNSYYNGGRRGRNDGYSYSSRNANGRTHTATVGRRGNSYTTTGRNNSTFGSSRSTTTRTNTNTVGTRNTNSTNSNTRPSTSTSQTRSNTVRTTSPSRSESQSSRPSSSYSGGSSSGGGSYSGGRSSSGGGGRR
jgi:hypothetical protein